MIPIKDKAGFATLMQSEYNIASNTAVRLGSVVKLVDDLVVLAAANETGAILGIAAENHSGTPDALNQRANGLKIMVYDSPLSIFAAEATTIIATGESATQIISASGFADEDGINALIDNDFRGGYVKLLSKSPNSANTDPVGTIYAVSSSDAGEKSLTINAAVTAGDRFALFPPFGFSKGNFDNHRQAVVLTAVAALPLRVVGRNFNTEKVEYFSGLHAYGNTNS